MTGRAGTLRNTSMPDAAVAPIQLTLPLAATAVRALHAGDYVEFTGTLYTGRDALHRYLAGGGDAPCDLTGTALYHCGPVVIPVTGGWQVTAAGPTTSMREEPYMAAVIRRFGLRGIIGKGGMGAATLAACREHGCAYFHAVGGSAQVLAHAIQQVAGVYFEREFGSPEAMWVMQVRGFPAVVTMDTHGVSLHARTFSDSARNLQRLLQTCDEPMANP